MLIVAGIMVCLLVGADQLIKFWAVGELPGKGSMQFLHIGDWEILNLKYVENSGAVFGSFAGMRWLLVGVTSVLMIACIWGMIRYRKHSKFLMTCLTLILAGGIGNLIDRLFRGGIVVDYFEVRLFDFAVFNFADCCVVIGVALFLVYILFLDGSDKKKLPDTATEELVKEQSHES